MKHNLKVTFVIMLLFLLSQFVGLLITSQYLVKPELPMNLERPNIAPETSFVPIFIFVLIATALILLMIHFNMLRFWRFGFFLSVFFCLVVSFSAFVAERVAWVIALVLAFLKVFKRNVIIHNFTEIFLYGALAAVFVPVLNVMSAAILLIMISGYDYIAVRKTKHMVKMAKFQGEIRMFPGLFVPYAKRTAILGGGDMGFPLLFAGVVLKDFGLGLLSFQAYIIPFFASLALLGLFLFGSEKKFYPAMPYLTAGCFLGYTILLLF